MTAAEPLEIPRQQEERSRDPGGGAPGRVEAHDPKDEPCAERREHDGKPLAERHRVDSAAREPVESLRAGRDVAGSQEGLSQRIVEERWVLESPHPELVDPRVGLEHQGLRDDPPLGEERHERGSRNQADLLEDTPALKEGDDVGRATPLKITRERCGGDDPVGSWVVEGQSLAERYAERSREALRPRPVDLVLRAADVAVSGLVLLLVSPLLLVVAASIRLTSGSPILYRGLRVGRFGALFTMYKFRTLRPDAELRLGPYLGEELSRRTEAEVTGLGRWLRASQLDELPQLWNILRGDMSLVGPRPIRPTFFEELSRAVPQYWQRLVVRPGLTGFAQTRVTRETAWEQKLAHDLEYIADRSLSLYLRVVAATAWRVLRQSVAAVWGLLGSRGR
ncbi:MAG: sugar transferase [Actinobacteria bacterium]|nr:MAG: sugar transferase [Actinomycetota bacterium]